MGKPTYFVYAKINEKMMPVDRGERYEDPLADVLEKSEIGEVSGGGTMMTAENEIEYIGIDIDLVKLGNVPEYVAYVLTELGAPKGSELQYEVDGQATTLPFGECEGIGVYLNGSDLSDEVYEENDINDLWDELDEALGDVGDIRSYWEGPTETALYLYGDSAAEMRRLIEEIVGRHPLCERCRIVDLT